MDKKKTYTIGHVAQMSGVSTRTLRYYEDQGLLFPAGRTSSGKRWYDSEGLQRLHLILLYRQMDLPIKRIEEILSNKNIDVVTELRKHRQLVEKQQKRLDRVIAGIDHHLSQLTEESMTNEEKLYDGLNQDLAKEYSEEAKNNWGNSIAWEQSQQRMARLSKEEIERYKVQQKELLHDFAEAFSAHKAIDSTESRKLCIRHHELIEVFYDASPDTLTGLAHMYVEDDRFKAYYDKAAPGLAHFVSDALKAYTSTL